MVVASAGSRPIARTWSSRASTATRLDAATASGMARSQAKRDERNWGSLVSKASIRSSCAGVRLSTKVAAALLRARALPARPSRSIIRGLEGMILASRSPAMIADAIGSPRSSPHAAASASDRANGRSARVKMRNPSRRAKARACSRRVWSHRA